MHTLLFIIYKQTVIVHMFKSIYFNIKGIHRKHKNIQFIYFTFYLINSKEKLQNLARRTINFKIKLQSLTRRTIHFKIKFNLYLTK